VNKDKIFTKKLEKQFQFDENVASVFDDMLLRSVPFYQENINLIIQIIEKFIHKNNENYTTILDLGASTGSLLLEIERKISQNLNLIGVDNSKAMIQQAQKKILALNSKIKLIEGDILKIDFPKANIIILNYTLQFIRPIEREELLKKISNSLAPNGILILTEKVITKNSKLNKILTDIYYKFKKQNGYSDYEIVQKREALENVLIPYTEDENRILLNKVGFTVIETVFKWINFTTFIAIKEK
jgi:tRNA (cmo5U34)-methyltransferase